MSERSGSGNLDPTRFFTLRETTLAPAQRSAASLDDVSLLRIDAEGSVLEGAQPLLVAPADRPRVRARLAAAKNGLKTVLETASRYSAVVHLARHDPLSIEELAASMDGDDRIDLLLVP